MSLLSAKIKRAMSRSQAPSGRPWNPTSLAQATKNQPLGNPVTRSYITNLESGTQSNPSVEAVTAISAALRVPPSYFLPGTPDDLDYVAWKESEAAECLLRTVMDLSAERQEEIIALAEQYRAMEQLPAAECPLTRSVKPPVRPASRRWFARRNAGDVLTADEVVHQITRSLLGQPDEE